MISDLKWIRFYLSAVRTWMYRIMISRLLELSVSLQIWNVWVSLVEEHSPQFICYINHVMHVTIHLYKSMYNMSFIVAQNSTNTENARTGNNVILPISRATTYRSRWMSRQTFSSFIYTILYCTVPYLYIPYPLHPILLAPENTLKQKVEGNVATSRTLKVTLNAAASFPTRSTVHTWREFYG